MHTRLPNSDGHKLPRKVLAHDVAAFVVHSRIDPRLAMSYSILDEVDKPQPVAFIPAPALPKIR